MRLSRRLNSTYLSLCCVVLLGQVLAAQVVQPKRLERADNSVPNDPVYRCWQEEATLRSIAFIDQDRLVAVGDRGTILVTRDAGRNWRLVTVPTSANLNDVLFIGQTGWAVGGWISKDTKTSYSIVLRSLDGGESWAIQNSEVLPRLIGIEAKGARLVCWGDYSNQLGSSVFSSLDGGISWQPSIKGISHAAAARSNATGQILAIDTLGRASVSNGQSGTVTTANLQVKALEAVESTWLACGEGGEFMASQDGLVWSDIQLTIHPASRPLCDWHSIAQHGGHVWVAGSPGSIVLRSTDGGRTWNSYPTGQTLPLNKLCFIDHQRGWAVGAQGRVLATRDGGQTWYSQRQQPARTALLTFAESTRSMPWPVKVATVWDSRRCVAAVALQHSEPIERTDTNPSHETLSIENARQVGLSDCVVCDVTADNSDLASSRLAVQILSWKPDVILTALTATDRLSESKLPTAINPAIQKAASEEFHSIVQSLYLRPWKIQKLVGVVEDGRSDFSEQSQRVLRESGLAIWDILLALPDADRKKNSQVNMQTIWARSQNRASQTDLLGGTSLLPETLLTGNIDTLGNYQLVMGRVQRDKMLKQLFRNDTASVSPETWSREFRFFAQSLPLREAFEMLKQLANSLIELQQYERASMVISWILQTSPQSDESQWASLRLLRLLANYQFQQWLIQELAEIAPSEESDMYSIDLAAVMNPKQKPVGQVRTANVQDASVYSPFAAEYPSETVESVAGTAQSPSGSQGMVIAASAQRVFETEKYGVESEEVGNQTDLTAVNEDWLNENLMIQAMGILQRQPAIRFRPEVMMQLVSLFNRCGKEAEARATLQELLDRTEIVSWHQTARQELAILDQRASELKWSALAARAPEPPLLDGVFNDRCWEDSATIELSSLGQTEDSPSSIKWAYDDEYLYVAVHCPRRAGSKAFQPAQRRSYDAELDGLDFVELTIDPSRDYLNACEFAVAENGLTYDRRAGDSSFNPKWYVQVESELNHWRAEIAIPMAELTLAPVDSRAVWAISARRIRPDALPQSWSQLRTHQRLPQANGLLIFN